MRKDLAWWTAFDWAPVGQGIGYIRGYLGADEICVPRQPLGVPLVHVAWKDGVARCRVTGERDGFLHLEPVHPSGEFLGAVQRATRRARRHGCIGAAGKRAQAILEGQSSHTGEYSPLEQVTTGDVAERQRLYDFGAVVAGFLRFSLPDAGSIW